ncbi:MAG: hypothetical protein P8Z73_13485 [Desulfobacteraceae bacterium]
MVLEAVMRIGKKSLKHPVLYGFAALAFIATRSVCFSPWPLSSPLA